MGMADFAIEVLDLYIRGIMAVTALAKSGGKALEVVEVRFGSLKRNWRHRTAKGPQATDDKRACPMLI